MIFLGIFSSFCQSHSSLCSFKKYKIFSIKIHKSFAKQFIEVPLTLNFFKIFLYKQKLFSFFNCNFAKN